MENISLTAAVKTLDYFLYDLKPTILFVVFKTVYSMLSNADGMEFPERAWVLRRCEQGSEPRPSSAVMLQALFKWEVWISLLEGAAATVETGMFPSRSTNYA